MVFPDLLRVIFGGLILFLIAGITLALRRRDDCRTRRLLAVTQIALAMPLVICAGLLVRSGVQRRLIYPRVGGDAARTAILALRKDKYGAPEKRKAFFDRVTERLAHVTGVHVVDTGAALPLANDDYFALYFWMGDSQPTWQPPMGQRFIIWQAEVDPDMLAMEINKAVKTFDRGIHYSTVTPQSPLNLPILVSSVAYATLSLLFIALSFWGETLRRGSACIVSGIVTGLGISAVITRLLTGLLFGVSTTNLVVFAFSAALVASVALVACLSAKRRATRNSSFTL
jgi:hypothetical protein